MHKEVDKITNYNIGLFLNYVIEDFYRNYIKKELFKL